MRFRAVIEVPAHTTVETLRDVEELLRGKGAVQLDLRAGMFGRVTFEFDAADSEPAPLSAMVLAVALDEARGLGVAFDEEKLRAIIGRAVATAETWHEVVEELKSLGWDVPHESVVRVP